jgi:hypothetical protein
MERVLQPDGRYAWGEFQEGAGNAEEVERFLSRRRRFDPDLWILELDTASAERFAAEMKSFD